MNNREESEYEKVRLQELSAYKILDTQDDKDFTNLAELAAQLCDAPMALISLVDKNRVWFKANKGVSIKEGPRSLSFCTHTIGEREMMVVNDLTKDERFKNNPLVIDAPLLKFYAGVPLVSSSGFGLGALCVIDIKPRVLSETQLSSLTIVANQVMNLMNLRLNLHYLESAKHQISENEKRFKSLAHGSPVGIFQTDAEGKGIYVNKKWCDIVGVSEKKAYNIDWVAAIHPEDRQKFLIAWAKSFSAKDNFTFSFRFQNKEKETRWVNSKASPCFDEHNKFIGYIGTLEDITKRKLTEIKLEQTEKLFNLIASNSRDLLTIFEANEKAKCVYVSPSSKEVLGYEPDELVGLSPFEMMPAEQAHILQQEYIPQILKGCSTRTENQLRKSDGSFIWVEALSKPIYNREGKILTFQSSVREITERKKFEHQLKEEKVKAEESAKAKSLFLSTMSHEIRTPMNAVIGLTNLLMVDNPREDQIQNLNLLKFSGQNLLALINDILDYNKIEAGKMEMESISFNVSSIVEKFAELSKGRAQAKGIELKVSLDENIPAAIVGDPVRFGQVMNNLISNAIKFTEKGTVSINGTLIEKKEDHCRIQFSILDTGIGIAPEKQSRIFENFSQASSDIVRKYGGTGLGLSITRKLLQLMNSDIQAKSELGKGSEFYFELNCKIGENESISVEKKQETAPSHALSVLLVEDNKVNQIVASSFLKKWGMTVVFANNGLEALTAIQRTHFDIVLMDLQMPEMDGYKATSEIRKMEGSYFKKVPILALSASVLPEIRSMAEQSGLTDFVTKPFQPDELKSKILLHAKTMETSKEISEAA